MPTKESFDIDGLMVFRSDLTAVDQDGNTVASVITPDKYVQSGKEPVSDEQMGRFTNTTAYWNAHSTYIPKKGEVIIYSDGGSITEGGTTVYIPKIKIGDGTTTVVNLPFTDSDNQTVNNSTINITSNGEFMDSFTLNDPNDKTIDVPDTDFVYICFTDSHSFAKTATSKFDNPVKQHCYYLVYIINSNTSDNTLTFSANNSTAENIYINGKISSPSNHTLTQGLYLVYHSQNAWFFNTDGRITIHGVPFGGSYEDLEDKPTIPAAQVNSDWNATSGIAQILNKPTLTTVTFRHW